MSGAEEALKQLVAMGFDKEKSKMALMAANLN